MEQNAPSIFTKQHPKIRQILEQAGSPAKALCVALDYAKAKHMALFCNGFGDILKKAFPVDNSAAGLQALLPGFGTASGSHPYQPKVEQGIPAHPS